MKLPPNPNWKRVFVNGKMLDGKWVWSSTGYDRPAIFKNGYALGYKDWEDSWGLNAYWVRVGVKQYYSLF